MEVAPASILGPLFGLSELCLALLKRSRGAVQDADRGTLRLLWLVILGSIAAGVVLARAGLPGGYGVGRQVTRVALCLFVGGLALRWYAIYYLGRFFTVDVAIATDHQVIDSGPYRYLRHPSYTGALLALLGFAITLGQLPAVLVVMLPTTLAFLKRIAVEEAALVAALGERYRRYCAHTRRLVPFVY
jgi:protein-S-isoprenylcysteine O-methyltransferase